MTDVTTPEVPVAPAPSAEEIARNYSALLDSASLINDVIAGTEAYANLSDEEKISAVERNVGHLEYMAAKDYWTDEDFSGITEAIAAGKDYIA
jgi:hypothetical protein